ncbi:methyl-accepting chemotaxis protein, partial [Desulfovibrio oxamicus]|nr:methyl-accepting chemotaxis protein [Nitratidesulfovibrio oxamicus]
MRHISSQTLFCAVGTGLLAAGATILVPLVSGTLSVSHGISSLAVACIAAVGLLVCRCCGQTADARLLHDTTLKGETTFGNASPAIAEAAAAIAALRDEALRNAAAGQAILEALDGQDAQPPKNASLSANSANFTDSAVPYLLLDTKGMVTCASPTLLSLFAAGTTPPALPATLEAVGLRPAPTDSAAAGLLRNLREGR